MKVKVVLYDDKHQTVIDCLELYNPKDETVKAIEELITMLRKHGIVNRYAEVEICTSYEVVYDEGEPLILFDGETLDDVY